MLMAYLVIMSSILANSNENDTFLKSLYFYTITMTTVGLGDIAVIGECDSGVIIPVVLSLVMATVVFSW